MTYVHTGAYELFHYSSAGLQAAIFGLVVCIIRIDSSELFNRVTTHYHLTLQY